jgi:molecular chaperone GrpE
VRGKKRGNGQGEDLAATVAPAEPVSVLQEAPEGEAPGAAEEASGLQEVPGADELHGLRRERDELRDALLRRRADFENYRRRVERDRDASAEEASAAILGQLLSTVDNLERALAVSETDAGLRQGVELTYRELLTLLESQGVTPVDPQGQRFDPALHQALVHEPTDGFEPGTVAEVFRKGYRYKERLLRPALVKVASGQDGREQAPDGGEGLQ